MSPYLQQLIYNLSFGTAIISFCGVVVSGIVAAKSWSSEDKQAFGTPEWKTHAGRLRPAVQHIVIWGALFALSFAPPKPDFDKKIVPVNHYFRVKVPGPTHTIRVNHYEKINVQSPYTEVYKQCADTYESSGSDTWTDASSRQCAIQAEIASGIKVRVRNVSTPNPFNQIFQDCYKAYEFDKEAHVPELTQWQVLDKVRNDCRLVAHDGSSLPH